MKLVQRQWVIVDPLRYGYSFWASGSGAEVLQLSGVFMSIDLLHRINASERRFRRGRGVIEEMAVDKVPGEEEEREIRKRGGRPAYSYSGDFIDQFKEL